MEISKDKALKLINEKISQFNKILTDASKNNTYDKNYKLTYHGAEEILVEIFSEKEAKNFRQEVTIPIFMYDESRSFDEKLKVYKKHLKNCIARLKMYKEEILSMP